MLPVSHRAVRFQIILAFPQRLTLIKLTFTTRHRDLYFCATVQEIQLQGNDRIPLVGGTISKPYQLLPVEQQLTFPAWGVVCPRAM